MKKLALLIVLILMAIVTVAAAPVLEFRAWEMERPDPTTNALIIEQNDWKCFITGFGDEFEYSCTRGHNEKTNDFLIQQLPEQINGGYTIYLIRSEVDQVTAVVAYNPCLETCRVFFEDGLFE